MRTTSAAVLLLLAAAGSIVAGGIGPDASGYTATDQALYSFVDISRTGVGVLAGADDDQADVAIGFPFRFYGQEYSRVCISSNGLLTFGGCNLDFANQDLTSTSPAGDRPTIAVFWTDLSFSTPGAGSVQYQTIGAAGSRQFVVQWTNAFPLNATQGVTFQAVLAEGTGKVLLQYRDVRIDAGSPAALGGRSTVGIRDTGGQTNGRRLQWSYNAPVLKDNSALAFSPGLSVPVDLGTAGPSRWAVLTLGRPTSITMSGSAKIGPKDAGVPAGGNVVMSGTAEISGRLLLNTGGTLTRTGNAKITGGVVKDAATDAVLNQAKADALAAAATAAALPPTITQPTSVTISNPNNSVTIRGVAGRNVINLSGITISAGTLTLEAPAGATFVVNVSRITMSGNGSIALAGGLTPASVLINVTGTSIAISGNGTLSGTLLAPNASLALSAGTINGEVIAGGGSLTMSGQAKIQN